MGFRVKRTTYKLKFKDPDYDGLEVTARSLSTGELWEFIAAEQASVAGDAGSQEGRRQMVQMLADSLVSWNAEDEETGQPIPMTVEGLLSQDPGFSARVMDAWTDALVGISAPLPQTSSDGQLSLEASIPMDAQSESLAS